MNISIVGYVIVKKSQILFSLLGPNSKSNEFWCLFFFCFFIYCVYELGFNIQVLQ